MCVCVFALAIYERTKTRHEPRGSPGSRHFHSAGWCFNISNDSGHSYYVQYGAAGTGNMKKILERLLSKVCVCGDTKVVDI